MGRGLAMGDLDDDGRVGCRLSTTPMAAPRVLQNELAGAGHWLRVKLKGKGKNTNADRSDGEAPGGSSAR